MLAPNAIYSTTPTLRARVNEHEGFISLPDANGYRVFKSDTGALFTVGLVTVLDPRGRAVTRRADLITEGGTDE